MGGGTRAGWWQTAGVVALGTMGFAAAAQADDYCCVCRGKPGKTMSAKDDLTAGAQCSVTCRRPTIPSPGKCATETPAPTAAPAAAAPSGTVLLFASDDCSGDETTVTASASRVAAGLRSFRVEAGSPASVWQQGNYAGVRTQPVGAGICISPGWEIGSVRFEGK